jgi:hypothetical protein
MNIFLFASLIFFGNIPFGWWRFGTRKFSLGWICAIHIPVLLIISSRLMLHMPYKLSTIPLTVLAFFVGQYSGGYIRKKLSVKKPDEKSGTSYRNV